MLDAIEVDGQEGRRRGKEVRGIDTFIAASLGPRTRGLTRGCTQVFITITT